MNFRAKFVFSIGLLGLLCLMLPGSLRADTVYTYTGNAYTSCYGTYTCTGTPPALSITFDTTLTGVQLDNLTVTGGGGDLTPYVTSFTITDGTGLSLTRTNAKGYSFDVTTNSYGAIIGWGINAGNASGPFPLTSPEYNAYSFGNDPYCGTAFTFGAPVPCPFDLSYTLPVGYSGGNAPDGGDNSGAPGSWAVTSTPEAGTASLLLIVFVLVMLKCTAQGLPQAT